MIRPRADEQKREGLTPKRIAQAALEMINEVGAQDFSLRNLAQRLKVTPMALYRHVGGRAELLGHVLDLILHDLGQNTAATQPRMSFPDLVRAYAALAMRFPQVLLAFLGEPEAHSQEAERVSELMIAALMEAGHDRCEAVLIRNIFVDHTHGYLMTAIPSKSPQNEGVSVKESLHRATSMLLEKLLTTRSAE